MYTVMPVVSLGAPMRPYTTANGVSGWGPEGAVFKHAVVTPAARAAQTTRRRRMETQERGERADRTSRMYRTTVRSAPAAARGPADPTAAAAGHMNQNVGRGHRNTAGRHTRQP